MHVASVEIFRTNVVRKHDSIQIIKELKEIFPDCSINFDLTDCDRILRVEGNTISIIDIIEIVKRMGFECELY